MAPRARATRPRYHVSFPGMAKRGSTAKATTAPRGEDREQPRGPPLLSPPRPTCLRSVPTTRATSRRPGPCAPSRARRPLWTVQCTGPTWTRTCSATGRLVWPIRSSPICRRWTSTRSRTTPLRTITLTSRALHSTMRGRLSATPYWAWNTSITRALCTATSNPPLIAKAIHRRARNCIGSARQSHTPKNNHHTNTLSPPPTLLPQRGAPSPHNPSPNPSILNSRSRSPPAFHDGVTGNRRVPERVRHQRRRRLAHQGAHRHGHVPTEPRQRRPRAAPPSSPPSPPPPPQLQRGQHPHDSHLPAQRQLRRQDARLGHGHAQGRARRVGRLPHQAGRVVLQDRAGQQEPDKQPPL
jgi:hypothetical protein